MKHALPILTLAWLALSSSPVSAQDSARQAILSTHAHNDYLHPKPLWDALAAGFQSVEADIFLVDGNLLVAHEKESINPAKSLRQLYLEPLGQLIKQNRGSVYPLGEAPFYLLIDLKSEAESTYAALEKMLADYSSWLTQFSKEGVKKQGAVTVIVSGNRPLKTMEAQAERLAGYDGRLTDLESPARPALMPWISDNWSTLFQWDGTGPLEAAERKKLKETVDKIHKRKQQVRFWAAPDKAEAWAALREAGVDFINTDRLKDLSEFMSQAARAPQ